MIVVARIENVKFHIVSVIIKNLKFEWEDRSWVIAMGKIRPAYIKRLARELVQKYPDVFTTDFETNKRLVEKYANVPSKKVRNRVAGYIVRLVKQRLRMEGLLPQSGQAQAEKGGQATETPSSPSQQQK